MHAGSLGIRPRLVHAEAAYTAPAIRRSAAAAGGAAPKPSSAAGAAATANMARQAVPGSATLTSRAARIPTQIMSCGQGGGTQVGDQCKRQAAAGLQRVCFRARTRRPAARGDPSACSWQRRPG